jgi:3D (Asp-Asp-Asp) domain-containing protein
LKVNPTFGGSALIFAALLSCSLVFSARALSAETLPTRPQPLVTNQSQSKAEAAASIGRDGVSEGDLGKAIATPGEATFVVPPTSYVATAYSLRGRTASGRQVSKGLIAADPRVLPLGSRVRLEAGAYSGEYLVADTGGSVRGRRIDIWTPTSREAMSFGRRMVKLTVLSLGGKRRAAHAVKK